jgi:hypothetical protein
MSHLLSIPYGLCRQLYSKKQFSGAEARENFWVMPERCSSGPESER